MTEPAPRPERRDHRSVVAPLAYPRPAKLAETIARVIEAEIVDRGWPLGRVIATEHDLRTRFGASREVTREAVRLLERESVAVMRRGPGGGLTVTRPDTAAITRAIALSLNYEGARLHSIIELRVSLELLAVKLAAARITEPGIARLRSVLEAERSQQDADPDYIGGSEVHYAIAELSGNPALRLVLEAASQLSERTPPPPDPDFRKRSAAEVRRAHSRIIEAVIAGDASLAGHRMHVHLGALERWLLLQAE